MARERTTTRVLDWKARAPATPALCPRRHCCNVRGVDWNFRRVEALAAPLRMLQETARRVAKVKIESKITVDEEEYVNSFTPALMKVAYEWSRGAKFSDLIKMTEIFEGSIIRAMRRLEELLRQLCSAANSIGNADLEAKFTEAIKRIKRDIIFSASLYL
jgi:ATP-dependent RNA helicase DOB1